MIKKHHTHIVLLILFFTGLIVLWWADNSNLPTEAERVQRKNYIVPDLMDVPPGAIHRVEVDNAHGKYVFERRKGGRWQMTKPIVAAAEAGLVARLANNIKELRRSPDAGTVQGAPETFGLNPPAATVRLFGNEPEKLLATLEVGKRVVVGTGNEPQESAHDRRYVRPVSPDGKKEGIEVADDKLLAAVDSDTYAWREKMLFDVPTFSITDLRVTGPDRDLEAQRVEGHWSLRKPLRVPANEDNIEGALAELVSLKVVEGKEGFVADDVPDRDLAKYGLDKPALTVTIKSNLEKEKPMVLLVGNPVPDRPDLYFAKRGDQDDVVWIDGKELRDLGTDLGELRSKKVADLDPSRATFVEVQAYGQDFRVSRTTRGWVLTSPTKQTADAAGVQNLLLQLSKLQALEFLEPKKAPEPRLNPPVMRVKVWQGSKRERLPDEPPQEPQGDLVVDLKIGRHGTLKQVYAQLEGDPGTVMALPDQILDVLPKNAFAFRERSVLALSPTAITRFTLKRDDRTYDLRAPEGAGNPNEWKLVAPVEAKADPEAVTQLTTLLSNLAADQFITDQPGDGKAFGLDHPPLSLTWKSKEAGESGTLLVGAPVPRSDDRYAQIEGKPMVFTLNPATLQVFREEFHDRKVLEFPVQKVSRVVLRWPDRTLAFLPRSGRGGPSSWRPERGEDAAGFDLSRLSALVPSLATLRTEEFVQFRGIFPASMGFDHPRLAIEIVLTGAKEPKVLRIGNPSPAGPLYATVETGSAGDVFTLAGPAWYALAKVPAKHYPDLPEDVFTPTPAAEKKK